MIIPDLTGLRPKRGYCGQCGAAFYSLGPESRWVPHQPGCPRGPKNVEAGAVEPRTDGSRKEGDAGQARGTAAMPPIAPASTERQDQEREALSDLEAPFRPMIRWPEGPSALSDFVHQKPSWRRQSVAPNYGQDGVAK